jgi:PilZ domain-containing protein
VTREQNARRYPRSKVQKPVLVAWKKGTEKHVSRVENLALGGLFVCTKDSPAVGTSLQLLFNTPEGEVRVRAIVRNLVSGRGMGLAIVSMEQEDRARLDRWLRRLAAEPEPASPLA